MNDNLNKKYKKKEKRAEKLERFFGKVFRGSCLTLMGCILLRYAPHFPFTSLARAGIIISEGAILASVVGIACILFYVKGLATILPPSFVSCVMGGVALLAIFIFDGISVVNEVYRRMHI